MIYIAINVIFNAFLLFIVFVIGSAFHKHNLSDWMLWDMAFAISAVLAIIGYTKLAAFLIGVFIPGRKAAGREISRLQPLLTDAINASNSKYGTAFNLQDFNIKMTDNKIAEAAALGHKTLIISSGAMDLFNDGQLRAVLGHELGHLYYGDSVRNIALIFSAFATRVVMWLYTIYIAVAAIFIKLFGSVKNETGTAGLIATIIPILIFFPVVALNWVGSKVFNIITMQMSRGAEYRADAFTTSLGYQADIISALEVLNSITIVDNSFLGKLVATHPAPMQRIGALEDEATAKKKMGKLFIARPMALNGKNIGGSSELLRLVIVLIIAGAIWGSVFYKEMLTPYKSSIKNIRATNKIS